MIKRIDRVGDKNLESRIVKWFKYFMFWNIWLEICVLLLYNLKSDYEEN